MNSPIKESLPPQVAQAHALGYLAEEQAKPFAGIPIGVSRLLTKIEEGNMLLCKFTREQIATMTPDELEEYTKPFESTGDLLLGA